jgi:arsenate reductase
MDKIRVLILCTGNSCRSQMAHGWFNHLGGEEFEVFSAGIETHGVNPKAIEVMGELGIDIKAHTSDLVTNYIKEDFDLVITVCGGAKESCPIWLGKVKKRVHWPFEDPAKASGTKSEIEDTFRRVRDQIGEEVKRFISKEKIALKE